MQRSAMVSMCHFKDCNKHTTLQRRRAFLKWKFCQPGLAKENPKQHTSACTVRKKKGHEHTIIRHSRRGQTAEATVSQYGHCTFLHQMSCYVMLCWRSHRVSVGQGCVRHLVGLLSWIWWLTEWHVFWIAPSCFCASLAVFLCTE